MDEDIESELRQAVAKVVDRAVEKHRQRDSETIADLTSRLQAAEARADAADARIKAALGASQIIGAGEERAERMTAALRGPEAPDARASMFGAPVQTRYDR